MFRITHSLVAMLTLAVACVPPPETDLQLKPGVTHLAAEGSLHSERFVQSIPERADILVVVDDDLSSAQTYDVLLDGLEGMLAALQDDGVDYHVGMVSSHASPAGPSMRWIDEGTAAPLDALASMIPMPEGAGSHSPRDAAFRALDPSAGDFRRDDAALHCLFVSDGADESTLLSLEGWVGWYQDTAGSQPVTLSAIVDFAASPDNVWATEVFRGLAYPIASPWSEAMDTISELATGGSSVFFLNQRPDPETLRVRVMHDGVEFAFDTVYDAEENSIRFPSELPPDGAVVTVEFEVVQ